MITVCIATYNGEKYILSQLNSILSQLGDNDQVVISDDNSTDKTIELIKSLKDNRIEIFTHSKETNIHKGVFKSMFTIGKNFENALIHAKEDYIFLSDQDDVWQPNKVEVVLAHLKSADCIVHNCTAVDSDLNVIQDSFFDYLPPRPTIAGTLYRSSFMGCCMAFNKKVLKRCLPFTNLPLEHDSWIGICALKVGKVKIIDDKLIFYRRHGMNISSCVEGSKNSLWVKAKRRLFMLWAFIAK